MEINDSLQHSLITQGIEKTKNPQAVYKLLGDLIIVAGAEGLEPSAHGFGDRCSTS